MAAELGKIGQVTELAGDDGVGVDVIAKALYAADNAAVAVAGAAGPNRRRACIGGTGACDRQQRGLAGVNATSGMRPGSPPRIFAKRAGSMRASRVGDPTSMPSAVAATVAAEAR